MHAEREILVIHIGNQIRNSGKSLYIAIRQVAPKTDRILRVCMYVSLALAVRCSLSIGPIRPCQHNSCNAGYENKQCQYSNQCPNFCGICHRPRFHQYTPPENLIQNGTAAQDDGGLLQNGEKKFKIPWPQGDLRSFWPSEFLAFKPAWPIGIHVSVMRLHIK